MTDVLKKIVQENDFKNGDSVVSVNNFGLIVNHAVETNKIDTTIDQSGTLDSRFDDINYYIGGGLVSSGGETPVGGTPVYESISTLSYGGYSSSSFAVDKPAGTSENDLLLFTALQNTASSITPPSGVSEITTGGSSRKWGVWSKIAGDSEPSTYAFGTGGGRMAIACLRFSSVDTSNPVPVFDTSGTPAGQVSNWDCPDVTSTVTDSIAVRVLFEYDDTGATAHSGITELFSNGNNSAADTRLAVGYDNDTYASGESCGIKGWTSTGYAEWYQAATLMIAGGS